VKNPKIFQLPILSFISCYPWMVITVFPGDT